MNNMDINACSEAKTCFYECLQVHKCLCMLNSETLESMWSDILHSFNITVFEGESGENLLLNASVISMIGETYFQESTIDNCICKNIYNVSKTLQKDLHRDMMIKIIFSSKDKFLRWALVKGFGTNMLCFPTPLFQKCIQQFLEILKQNMGNEDSQQIFQLLAFICKFNERQKMESAITYRRSINTCQNKVSSKISPTLEIAQILCIELSHYWPDFMEVFKSLLCLQEKESWVSDFFDLWISVINVVGKKKTDEVTSLFMNSLCILDFFFIVYRISPLCLPAYLDIIIEIFSSSVKYQPFQEHEIQVLEKAIKDSFNQKFLSFILSFGEVSGFCKFVTAIERRCTNEITSESGMLKKVIYIILCCCACMNNESCMIETYLEVEGFLKKQFFITKYSYGYIWILDMFFEQDDLLFGAMLATLRIYSTVKKTSSIKCEHAGDFSTSEQLTHLNAHKVFIKFLYRIGFYHHTLLEFLMTDETCFLLYLTSYLKFLIQDWDNFVEAHRNCSEFSNDEENETSLEQPEVSSESFESEQHSEIHSSASSNEKHFCDKMKSSEKKSNSLEMIKNTIKVLMKLKNSITKLVKRNEFPYNVQHLIDLVNMCEVKYVTHEQNTSEAGQGSLS